MRNVPLTALSAPDSASATGAAIFVGQSANASFVTSATATAAGTVKIQGSNDLPVSDPKNFVPTNWNDITNATSAIASGTGPAIVIAVLPFQYIRVVYTRTSGGTGTITVNASTLAL